MGVASNRNLTDAITFPDIGTIFVQNFIKIGSHVYKKIGCTNKQNLKVICIIQIFRN